MYEIKVVAIKEVKTLRYICTFLIHWPSNTEYTYTEHTYQWHCASCQPYYIKSCPCAFIL